MTYCPGCLRSVDTDVIPAIKYAGAWIPAWVVCRWCGWVVKEIIPEEESEAS